VNFTVRAGRGLPSDKEGTMYGRGKEQGTRRVKPGSTPQFDQIQAEYLARIEREWAERAAEKQPVGQK